MKAPSVQLAITCAILAFVLVWGWYDHQKNVKEETHNAAAEDQKIVAKIFHHDYEPAVKVKYAPQFDRSNEVLDSETISDVHPSVYSVPDN